MRRSNLWPSREGVGTMLILIGSAFAAIAAGKFTAFLILRAMGAA